MIRDAYEEAYPYMTNSTIQAVGVVRDKEEELPENQRIHKLLCEDLHITYVAKNNDYGNSFAKVRGEFSNAVLIRLSDKLERLKTLVKKEEEAKATSPHSVPVEICVDESIEDTLLDLANYALMEIVERQLDKKK